MTIQSNSNNFNREDLVKPSITPIPDNFESYKIYLLRRIYSTGPDEFMGKVIIASSAKAARKVANLKVGDEGQIWDNTNLVMCKEIGLDFPAVVLEAFNAG